MTDGEYGMYKRFEKDIKKYLNYSIVAAKAQLKSEVANSYLNWVWWILDPLCFMLIYMFVFGYVFQSKEPFFAIFIFIGLTMWNFFNHVITNSVRIVKRNKSIVSKVYFPKYILILTDMWVNGFKMLISFGIVLLLMIGYRVPITINILFAFPVMLAFALMTFGISCFMLHYGVYVEDLSNVIKIVLKMLFYVTGIFYNVETKIPVYGKMFGRANPVAFLITAMRNCLIYETAPSVILLGIWTAAAFAAAVLGIWKIYKEENSYVKAI